MTAPIAEAQLVETVLPNQLAREGDCPRATSRVFGAPDAHREAVGLREEPAPEGHEPLLVPVMAAGRRIRPAEGVEAARARFQADLAWLPDQARDPRAGARAGALQRARRAPAPAGPRRHGPACGRHPVRAPAEHYCIGSWLIGPRFW